ncbi:hypothetical protein HHI36_013568 [Cryptolaemus montrouzieri]
MKMRILVLLCMVTTVYCEEDLVLKEFVKANNNFSFYLYDALSTTCSDNFIVSPLSVETILALTALGAKGETASELQKALNLPSDTEKTKEQFRTVKPLLIGSSFSTVSSANRIYIEKGFGITPEFLSNANNIFDAGAENVNFGEADETARKINQWVENQTNGKIKNLIDPDKLNELTRIVLANTLYFKGQWVHGFKSGKTKPMDFHKTESETVKVDTMETIAYLKYVKDESLDVTLVELPYRGNGLSLTIAIPNTINGLSSSEYDIYKMLSIQNYTSDNVKLFLPKFKVETSLNLIPTFRQLGVRKLFNREADLSGISIKDGLYVSNVLQKVFIDVNEQGTEAAAASGVISNSRSAGVRKLANVEIKVDRPFLFFLRLKNIVLFIGRITVL